MPLFVARSGVNGGPPPPPLPPPLTPFASGPPHPLPSIASAVDLAQRPAKMKGSDKAQALEGNSDVRGAPHSMWMSCAASQEVEREPLQHRRGSGADGEFAQGSNVGVNANNPCSPRRHAVANRCRYGQDCLVAMAESGKTHYKPALRLLWLPSSVRGH